MRLFTSVVFVFACLVGNVASSQDAGSIDLEANTIQIPDNNGNKGLVLKPLDPSGVWEFKDEEPPLNPGDKGFAQPDHVAQSDYIEESRTPVAAGKIPGVPAGTLIVSELVDLGCGDTRCKGRVVFLTNDGKKYTLLDGVDLAQFVTPETKAAAAGKNLTSPIQLSRDLRMLTSTDEMGSQTFSLNWEVVK
ncbi:hypothetical protein [Rhizobium sp. R693]|uniref:hypothetical protein n=1 Tax=Rhizobium sp. R693 TaxID=1764276 RepID=UPI0011321E4F|nr:hypothetical protein [Rhizobium sp. R693]